MDSPVRFGIIGCGEIAVQTCLGISSARNARIAMFMDSKPEATADLAELYGVPATTDVEEVLANPSVDAVYIATPHDLHAPIGIRAAQAGKHVLVEKPVATDLAGADALIAACAKADVRLGVAFMAQVDAGCAAARDYIRAGLIGEVIAVRMSSLANKAATYWRGGFTQRVATTWRQSKSRAGGGILIMNLVHDINTVRWVTGLEVERVYAEYGTLATPVEVEDTLAATLRYANGAVGALQGGSALPGGGHLDVRGPRVLGTKGQIILANRPLIYQTEVPEGDAEGWSELRFDGPLGDRQQLIERFAGAVLEGRRPPADGVDGRKALEIIVAAYRSMAEGRPVTLPLAF